MYFNEDDHDEESIICLSYGEIDCRCHIQRQIDGGRKEDDVIGELVDSYLTAIRNIVKFYRAIIIFAVVPPTQKVDYERRNGPITHKFPFLGADEDRVRFTKKVNDALEMGCEKYNYIFLNPYTSYRMDNGCLKYDLSDGHVHVLQNKEVLRELYEVLDRIWATELRENLT
jgi:hypothetical protein